MNNIIEENANIFDTGYFSDPLDVFFESIETDPSWTSLDEASYNERAKKEILKLEVLDVEKYIAANELKPITNPTFFAGGNIPTSDGLLSNEIFGITTSDRSGTFAYIDLGDWFIDPSCYKILLKLDKNFNQIIQGHKKYKVDANGLLVEDENGGTGIRWLKGNFGKIKIKQSESRKRDMQIRYIKHNFEIGRMFISKYIVIPPFYRDVNTSGKYTGVGQINSLYVNLIVAARAIKENNDYGLSIADMTCARIQNTLKGIYDYFCGNTNSDIEDGTGLGGKFGIIRMGNMNYTSDYSSRLVISAPELKSETIDDLMVSLNKSAIPLAAVAADFYPFMIFNMRRFFENEFLNVTNIDAIDSNNNKIVLQLQDPMLAFNDDVLKERLKQFVYSHDTRFQPIEIPVKNNVGNKHYFMHFKGRRWDPLSNVLSDPDPLYDRPLTWVDVIYICAIRSTEGKQISITRYPYDSYFNTIYTGIEVASIKETEPMYIDGEYYRFYPKIRLSDINRPSAQKFIDTMQISNLYLEGMGGDYDGDMVNVKGSFFNETNDELKGFVDSKANFINMGCSNIRVSTKEAIQAMYNMTLVLKPDLDKLTEPKF